MSGRPASRGLLPIRVPRWTARKLFIGKQRAKSVEVCQYCVLCVLRPATNGRPRDFSPCLLLWTHEINHPATDSTQAKGLPMRTILTLLAVTCLITGCSNQQPTAENVSVETETPQATPVAASESLEEPAEMSAAEEPAEASEESKLLLIDVRTQAEWDEAHLDIATHIPLDQITDRISEVAPDKDQQIYLHCRSGGRCEVAKAQLEGLGYTSVENVGGLEDARTKFESGDN